MAYCVPLPPPRVPDDSADGYRGTLLSSPSARMTSPELDRDLVQTAAQIEAAMGVGGNAGGYNKRSKYDNNCGGKKKH